MNTPITSSMNAAAGQSAARALFAAEELPFPPVPGHLEGLLRPAGPAWFATGPVASSPYGLEDLLARAQGGNTDWAVIGFDGHGVNSWAAHCYVVIRALALFVQLPWGGIYTNPARARQDIAAMFDWAARLQATLARAEAARHVPPGLQLQVVASRFTPARWRWTGGERVGAAPWNPPAGMLATILSEADCLAERGRLNRPGSPGASLV